MLKELLFLRQSALGSLAINLIISRQDCLAVKPSNSRQLIVLDRRKQILGQARIKRCYWQFNAVMTEQYLGPLEVVGFQSCFCQKLLKERLL